MSLATLISAMMPASLFAAGQLPANNFTFEPEFSMDSGDYGGGSTIKVYSMSITGTYEFAPNWSLALTVVPYLHQDETYTDVVLVAGKPVHHLDATGFHPHHDDTRMPNPSLPGNTLSNSSQVARYAPGSSYSVANTVVSNTPQSSNYVPGSTYSTSTIPQTSSTVTSDTVTQATSRHGSANGIGDTFVSLSYNILQEDSDMPGVSMHAGVKLPTADEDKGLGTGKIDYQTGLELSKGLGRWFLDGGIDYNILGDPDGYDLDNYVSGYTSVSTGIMDNMEVALQLSAAQAASDVSDDAVSMGVRLDYFLRQAGSFSADLQKGLTDGCPDYSITVGYSISF